MDKARFYALFDTRDLTTRVDLPNLIDETDWEVNPEATRATPPHIEVLSIDRDVEEGGLIDAGESIRHDLEVQQLMPSGLVGRAFGGGGDNAMPTVFAMTSGSVPSAFGGLWDQLFGDPPKPPDQPPVTDETGDTTKDEETPKEEKKAKEAEKPKAAEEPKPAVPETATTIKAALAGFGDASKLWTHVPKAARGSLAEDLIPTLYSEKAAYAKRSEWMLAPDMVLLEACPEHERAHLAAELLKVRNKLTDAGTKVRAERANSEEQRVELLKQDVELAKKRVDLAEQDTQLAKERVKLAGAGVNIANEMYQHMKKWRTIANWGVAILIATTIFSSAAIAYVLLELMNNDKVSDAAGPVMIFVLALLAISPAVLLLLERPLDGLDKWNPSTSGQPAEEEDETSESGTGESDTAAPGTTTGTGTAVATVGQTPAAATASTNGAPASTTTTG